MTIYLCGPINGCTDSECKDWREAAKTALPECEFLDPMRRDYRGREDECAEEIVEGDIADIDASDLLLVNAPSPSWGTAMEVFYAYRTSKTVAMVCPQEAKISPWQRFHSHHIFHSFEDAISFIREAA